jgi:hypothetical protein
MGQSAIERIHREVSGARIGYEPLDLSNLASIADFSQRMQARDAATAARLWEVSEKLAGTSFN